MIVCVEVCVQLASEMVNVTVLVPDVLYNTPPGFSDEEVPGVAPLPKSQLNDQLLPEVPVLLKLTGVRAHCGAVEVNVAVGVWKILIVVVAVTAQLVAMFVIVSVTVLIPAVA